MTRMPFEGQPPPTGKFLIWKGQLPPGAPQHPAESPRVIFHPSFDFQIIKKIKKISNEGPRLAMFPDGNKCSRGPAQNRPVPRKNRRTEPPVADAESPSRSGQPNLT